MTIGVQGADSTDKPDHLADYRQVRWTGKRIRKRQGANFFSFYEVQSLYTENGKIIVELTVLERSNPLNYIGEEAEIH